MKKQAGKKKRFWTGARVALAFAAFGGVALIASNCKSNDTANLATNSNASQAKRAPQVTITKQPGAQPQPQPQLETVPAAAWNTEIKSVDGATFRLSDFKDKVVVVDLCDTWCGRCRLEIPHLVDLQKEYGGKGVEIIGLTTEDPNSDEAKVR